MKRHLLVALIVLLHCTLATVSLVTAGAAVAAAAVFACICMFLAGVVIGTEYVRRENL